MTRDELIELQARTDAMERVNMRVRIAGLERRMASVRAEIVKWNSHQRAGEHVLRAIDAICRNQPP